MVGLFGDELNEAESGGTQGGFAAGTLEAAAGVVFVARAGGADKGDGRF